MCDYCIRRDEKMLTRRGCGLNQRHRFACRRAVSLPCHSLFEMFCLHGKNRETYHGVTIHEMTEAIDAGPILAQTTFSIYPEFEGVADVYQRSLRFAWELFVCTMPVLDYITARAQDESMATYYGMKD